MTTLKEKLAALQFANMSIRIIKINAETKQLPDEVEKCQTHMHTLDRIEADLKMFYGLANWVNRNIESEVEK